MLARIEAEQAQVDLDVAVGMLQPAERENSFPGAGQMGMVVIQAGQLQRGVGLYGRADFRRSAGVNIEAAVGQLTGENGAHRLVD